MVAGVNKECQDEDENPVSVINNNRAIIGIRSNIMSIPIVHKCDTMCSSCFVIYMTKIVNNDSKLHCRLFYNIGSITLPVNFMMYNNIDVQ